MKIENQYNFKFKTKDNSEFKFYIVALNEAEAKQKLLGYVKEILDQIKI